MGFFEVPDEVPDEPEEFEQPDWAGPPEGVLAGVVAAQVVIARTEDVLIAASHIAVYPNGMTFDVLGFVGRLPSPGARRHGLLHDDQGDARTALRIGLLLADGQRVQNLYRAWPSCEDEVAGPVLIEQGGGSGERTFRQGYWTWPAPAPGPVVLVVEWPALAVPESRATIAPELLEDARARIQVVWPGGRPSARGWSSGPTNVAVPNVDMPAGEDRIT